MNGQRPDIHHVFELYHQACDLQCVVFDPEANVIFPARANPGTPFHLSCQTSEPVWLDGTGFVYWLEPVSFEGGTIQLTVCSSFKTENPALLNDQERARIASCRQVIQMMVQNVCRDSQPGECDWPDDKDRTHASHDPVRDDSAGLQAQIVKEKALMLCIESGQISEAIQIMVEILDQNILPAGKDWDSQKIGIIELIVLISRSILHRGADQATINTLNQINFSKIDRFRNQDEIKFWIVAIFEQYIECSDRQTCNISREMKDAITFIKRNYRSELSLRDVASSVYQSPSYFSRLFKKETGENFSDYINRVRIDQAKKLLLEEHIPLNRLATEVGYSDQSYFSKIFKKKTGLSPRQYRDSMGRVSGTAV